MKLTSADKWSEAYIPLKKELAELWRAYKNKSYWSSDVDVDVQLLRV